MAYFWSSTILPGQLASHVYIPSGTGGIYWQNNSAQHAFSVRCLRDF
jgi:uncharacterized protein (TIGR02145 family)